YRPRLTTVAMSRGSLDGVFAGIGFDFDSRVGDSRAPMAEATKTDLMEKIVALCKRRGFIFQSSDIYGGLNGFWDYGPVGAELKRNIKDAWWNDMVRKRTDVVGIDATIIMHP